MKSHASQFETTRFYDRNGDLLYEMIDPNAGRRTYIPLEEISPYVIAATIAVEDKEFYNHPGFDPVALARALVRITPAVRWFLGRQPSPSNWHVVYSWTSPNGY